MVARLRRICDSTMSLPCAFLKVATNLSRSVEIFPAANTSTHLNTIYSKNVYMYVCMYAQYVCYFHRNLNYVLCFHLSHFSLSSKFSNIFKRLSMYFAFISTLHVIDMLIIRTPSLSASPKDFTNMLIC